MYGKINNHNLRAAYFVFISFIMQVCGWGVPDSSITIKTKAELLFIRPETVPDPNGAKLSSRIMVALAVAVAAAWWYM